MLNKHKIDLKEKAKPRVHKLRRIKPEHMEAVKKEIDKLLAKGCIQPMEHTEWISPLVIVLKKNGKVGSSKVSPTGFSILTTKIGKHDSLVHATR